ncbi:MAG TPA: PAS domain S-box protein, partial [Stenomitos sp.]
TTVDEVRQFLQCDRVIIFQFSPGWGGTVVVESVAEEWMPILPLQIYDPCIGEEYVEPFKQGLVTAKTDIYTAGISPCHVEFLASLQVRANLVVPVMKEEQLWGLLVAHHCATPREWQSSEIVLLRQLGAQVSIALQQSALFEQVQTELAERKQAEAALQEREAILRLFARYAPAGIAMLDRDMRYLMASQRWVDEYHLDSIESLMNRSHYELFPEIPERWRQIHQQCLAGAIEKSDEDLFVRADGTEQWISWEIRPWYTATDDIGGIIIFSVDVTQRKQAEIALQESKIQLQRQLSEIETIYQSAPIGLNVLDTELRFVRINQRLADMNGLSVAAHIGHTIRELLPDLADAAEQVLHPIVETGEPLLNVEIIGETPAQPGVQRIWLESFLPLRDGDRIIGISTVCEEITERKQAEQRLAKELLRIQTLFDTCFDGIVILDLHGNVLEANPRFAQMLGYTREETAKLTVFDWDAQLAQEELQQLMQNFINLKSGVFETRHRRQDGSIYDVEISVSVVDWDGEILRFCACRDISDRKQAQMALQQLNAELELRVQERTAELTEVNDRLLNALIALQESEESRRLALDLTHIGFWNWHLPSHTLIWNDNHFTLLGLTPYESEPSYELWRSHIHPDDVDWVEQQFLESLENQTDYTTEYRVVHRDGSVHWLMARARAIYDELRQPVRSLGVLLDISDRKQSEAALQQQSQQEQLLLKITQSIRQSLDLNVILNTAVTEVRQTLQTDRAAVYRFNPNWSGDFVVESVGTDWINLVEPDICKIWEDTYLQKTQGGRFRHHESFVIADIYTAGLEPCHIELLEQFQAKAYVIAPIFSGEVLWGLLAIYQNATPRRWQSWEVELLQQISNQLSIAIQQSELYGQLQIELHERKQAAAVLREADRRWRSLLDNVQLLVVGLDQTGAVNYVNPFFLNLTGYTQQEVIGKNWFENFLPQSYEQPIQTIFSDVLTHNPYPYYQNFILTKSGEERFIAWNNTMLQDLVGTSIGTISIGEDITERQKVEQMKNEFIGIVSHELRTPLTAIKMSLGLLKSGIYDKKPDKFQRMLEIALIDTNRLVNLVNDILDLERLDSGRAALAKTRCQAIDLIQQAVDGVQPLATGQQIKLIIAPTDAQVWAAADAIIQTLTNLLSNAIKFSPANSTITLCANAQADLVLFHVSDQGRGIPADQLETIFGRFQQVDVSDARQKGGTGLGLAICRSIIEQHGGKIWAESTLGEGSTFLFTLPLPPEDIE